MPRDRSLVGIVECADRLEVGGVVALGIVRAAVEDVPGPARSARDEMPVTVLRTGDLEGQRIRRRRTFFLDERAVGVARAAHERPEAPALPDERSLAALRADFALPGLRRCLLARERPGFLVL